MSLIQSNGPVVENLRQWRELQQLPDRQAYQVASENLLALKQIQQKTKAKKEEFLAPTREITRAAKNVFGDFEEELENTEIHMRKLLIDFVQHSMENAKAQREGLVLKRDFDALLENMQVVPQVSGISFRSDWEVEVTCLDQVPAEYLRQEIDLPKIKKAAKAGIEIPGLIIKRKLGVSVTTPKGTDG
jgi:hypothetical protein